MVSQGWVGEALEQASKAQGRKDARTQRGHIDTVINDSFLAKPSWRRVTTLARLGAAVSSIVMVLSSSSGAKEATTGRRKSAEAAATGSRRAPKTEEAKLEGFFPGEKQGELGG